MINPEKDNIILYLAPILGITDSAFRTVFANHFNSFDLAVAPFLSTLQGGRYKKSKLADLLPEKNISMPVDPQIISNSSPDFIALAKILYEMGYNTVNWNLGCPMPTLTKKRKGSGLLPYPDAIDQMLEDILNNIPNQLTVKLRLGWESPREIEALFPILNRYPIKEIIIHPRTGKQIYTGTTDLDSFATCLKELRTEVAFNGDINTLDDYKRLKCRFPTINRWMIGRGALSDPFLPGKIKNLEVKEENQVPELRAYHDSLLKKAIEISSGEHHAVIRMKSLWHYLAPSMNCSQTLTKKIFKSKDLESFKQAAENIFDNIQLAQS